MSRGLAVLLGAGAGCLVGMQAPINSRLGKSIGGVQAATFSFLVGTTALVLLSAVLRGGLGTLGHVTPEQLCVVRHILLNKSRRNQNRTAILQGGYTLLRPGTATLRVAKPASGATISKKGTL